VADEERPSGKDDERPAFARDFPRDPELDALVAAFSAGDFARVRGEAPRVIASSADDAVKRAAETLVTRTKPDPIAALLVGVTAVLLVALSAWWITHDGPP
jgi:anti-sigma factor RsiW